MIIKLTAICMLMCLTIQSYIVMHLFIVFLENCGLSASQFSPRCGINFSKCSECPFSTYPLLFCPYIKETRSVLLACKLGQNNVNNEGQNLWQ